MTAVEFIFEELENRENGSYSFTMEQIYNKAKEIEKQQKGYSEEELKSAFKIGFNIGYGSSVQELDLKNEHCDKWFEQNKNK